MPVQPKRFYDFGPYRLDPAKRLLLKDGEPVPLTPKAFDTLLVLVEESGQVLEKDVLMKRLWPTSFVEEGNLTVNISMLRKALGESPNQHLYIVTVPGKGYRFVASVRETWIENADLVVKEYSRSQVIIESEEAGTETDAAGRIAEKGGALMPVAALRWKSRRVLSAVFALAIALVAVATYLWIKERGKATGGGAGLTSIAVLPFKMLSPDPSDEYLKIGMAETLITRLSKIKQIIVRPSTAVQNYGGLDRNPARAGQELKVEAVLDGSIQKMGDRIRVIVQLVRVEDGQKLYTSEFNGDCKSILEIQDSISGEITRALKLTLSREDEQLLAKRYTDNTEAYNLYLKGRDLWNKRTPNDLEKAIALFKQAIDKDRNYALAYAGLADSYALLASGGQDKLSPAQAMLEARKAATQALALDDDLPEAHISLAVVHLHYDWDWSGAERELTQAIALAPNHPVSHYWYSLYLIAMGRIDESILESNRANELDPITTIVNANAARTLYFARRYDEAIQKCKDTLARDQDSRLSCYLLGACYQKKGMYPEAIAEFEKLLGISKHSIAAITALGHAYAESGNSEGAANLLQELMSRSNNEYVPAVNIAEMQMALGNNDSAFKYLEEAYKERSNLLVYIKTEPMFDSLRSDPRFSEFLRRTGLSQF